MGLSARYDFVKLTLSGAQVADGKPQKKFKQRFITYRSWKKYEAHLEGPHWEVEAECRWR